MINIANGKVEMESAQEEFKRIRPFEEFSVEPDGSLYCIDYADVHTHGVEIFVDNERYVLEYDAVIYANGKDVHVFRDRHTEVLVHVPDDPSQEWSAEKQPRSQSILDQSGKRTLQEA